MPDSSYFSKEKRSRRACFAPWNKRRMLVLRFLTTQEEQFRERRRRCTFHALHRTDESSAIRLYEVFRSSIIASSVENDTKRHL